MKEDPKDQKDQNYKDQAKIASTFPCLPCGKPFGSSYDLNRHKASQIHLKTVQSIMDLNSQIGIKNSDIQEIKIVPEIRKSSRLCKVNVRVIDQNVESIVDLEDFNPGLG